MIPETGWKVSYKGGDSKNNCLVFTHDLFTEGLEVIYKSKQNVLEIKSKSSRLSHVGQTTMDKNNNLCQNYEVEEFDSCKIKEVISDILARLIGSTSLSE